MEAALREQPLAKKEILELIQWQKGSCVSIYMPAHRVGTDTQQNQIRFKNLLREAAEKLSAAAVRPADVDSLLTPAQDLLRNAPFWKQQNEGLAVFLSPGFFRSCRLPLEFRELVVVAERFHIKPMIPLFTGSSRFHVLAVSQNAVRLFEGIRNHLSEMELTGIPKNLAETVKFDVPAKQLRSQPAVSAGGGRGAPFHGHGGWEDNSKDNLLRYLQQIDRGLRGLLKDERAPLVFAGVEYIFAMYRDITSHPNLMGKAITGNPEGWSADELWRQARAIVQPYYIRVQEEAIAQYRQSAGTGLASNNIAEIVPAAYHGRIGLVFVARDREQRGVFNAENNEVVLHPKGKKVDEDLLDLAAVHTYLNGGTVYTIEPERMPGSEPIAALFRY